MASLTQFLILFCAALWPWGVYQALPGPAPASVAFVAAAVLCLLGCVRMALGRSESGRVSKGLAAAVVVAIVLVLATAGMSSTSAETAGALLLCLVCVQQTPSLATVRLALVASCLSAAVIATLGLAAEPLRLLPAACSPAHDAILATLPGFAPAVTAFLCLTFVLVWTAWRQRGGLGLWWILPCAVPVGVTVWRNWSAALAEAALARMGHSVSWHLATAVLVAAPLCVCGEAARRWRAAEGDRRAHLVLSAGLCAILGAGLVLGVRPDLSLGLLLGLAGALVVAPAQAPGRAAPWLALFAVGCGLLVGPWTPWGRVPRAGDSRDYRSYAALAAEQGRIGAGSERLEYLRTRFPEERGLSMCLARLALQEQQICAAVWYFGESIKPTSCGQAFPVSPEEEGAFIEVLRQRCEASGLRDQMFAYERALFIHGQPREAIASLRASLRNPVGDRTVEEKWRPVFLRALLFLLGHTSEADVPVINQAFDDWKACELLTLLERRGAVIQQAPTPIVQDALPVAFVCDGAGGVATFNAVVNSRVSCATPFVVRPLPVAHWAIAGRTAEQKTELVLRADTLPDPLARVTYPDAVIERGGRALPGLGAPAVLILLP